MVGIVRLTSTRTTDLYAAKLLRLGEDVTNSARPRRTVYPVYVVDLYGTVAFRDPVILVQKVVQFSAARSVL